MCLVLISFEFASGQIGIHSYGPARAHEFALIAVSHTALISEMVRRTSKMLQKLLQFGFTKDSLPVSYSLGDGSPEMMCNRNQLNSITRHTDRLHSETVHWTIRCRYSG